MARYHLLSAFLTAFTLLISSTSGLKISMANREQRTNIKQLFAKDVGAVSIEGNDFVVVELRGGGEREDGTRVIALMAENSNSATPPAGVLAVTKDNRVDGRVTLKDGNTVSVVDSVLVKESTRQYEDCRDSLPAGVCYTLLTNNPEGPVQNECRGALMEFLAPYCRATCNECCGDANLPYPLCETIEAIGLCNVDYFDDAFSGRLCRKTCGRCT